MDYYDNLFIKNRDRSEKNNKYQNHERTNNQQYFQIFGKELNMKKQASLYLQILSQFDVKYYKKSTNNLVFMP